MERLTKIHSDGTPYWEYDGDNTWVDVDFGEEGRFVQGKLVDRLAAYEDTGLTPEEINTIARSQIATAKHNVELQEEIEELKKELSESVSFYSANNYRDRAYLIGYEDGRMGNKCDYKNLEELL